MTVLNPLCENSERIRVPDFIIAGAMKCGTSSLHHILAAHPDIFIPSPEIHFYDADDILQYPDFVLFQEGRWWHPDYDGELTRYQDWYASFYAGAEGHQVWGEDSTTYLASAHAAERIAKLNPNAKLIIMLRDPASRTYSHYWHLVRTGRAFWTFENSLRFSPNWNLIERSLYKPQVDRLLYHIPRKNIYFIIFEDSIEDVFTHVVNICEFIGVDASWYTKERVNIHENPAQIPRSLPIQLWRNRMLREYTARRYRTHLPWMPKTKLPWRQQVARFADRCLARINPLQAVAPPPMNLSTRRFLNRLFAHENDGLDKLIGKELTSSWYRE